MDHWVLAFQANQRFLWKKWQHKKSEFLWPHLGRDSINVPTDFRLVLSLGGLTSAAVSATSSVPPRDFWFLSLWSLRTWSISVISSLERSSATLSGIQPDISDLISSSKSCFEFWCLSSLVPTSISIGWLFTSLKNVCVLVVQTICATKTCKRSSSIKPYTLPQRYFSDKVES